MGVMTSMQLISLDAALQKLPTQHRNALQWFVERAGTEQPWPSPLDDDTLLATKAKGIYKPQWSEYALSVRQVLGGPYPDRDPVYRPDGGWTYAYFQENKDVHAGNGEFTNKGLMACWRDHVPVGVMRQVSDKSPVRYMILGVALVAGWEGGYFFLEGFSHQGFAQPHGPKAELQLLQSEAIDEAKETSWLTGPENELDGRRRIVAEIVRRQGQLGFRRQLLQAYEGRCAITGWDAIDALEAAHILPYRGPATNHVSNGLLLRADIHTLFDIGKVAVDERTMTVIVAPELAQTQYWSLAGSALALPKNQSDLPNLEALKRHREWSGL